MSVRSVLGGKKRRRGLRVKQKSKRKRAEVKIKIKGSPAQAANALRKLASATPPSEVSQ